MTDLKVLRLEFEGEWWAFELATLIAGIDEIYADLALLDVVERLAPLIESKPQEGILFRSRIDMLLAVVADSSSRSGQFLREDEFALEEKNAIERPIPLQLLRINYGSDGGVDFLGVGRLAEAVASVFNGLLEHIRGAPDREAARLKVIERKLEMAKKAGMSERQIEGYARELLSKHDRQFRKLIESQRIKKPVKLLPAPKEASGRQPPNYYL
jgi:hypothetical protein